MCDAQVPYGMVVSSAALDMRIEEMMSGTSHNQKRCWDSNVLRRECFLPIQSPHKPLDLPIPLSLPRPNSNATISNAIPSLLPSPRVPRSSSVSSSDSEGSPVGLSHLDKKLKRKNDNRLSAARSRERKKQHMEELEERLGSIANANNSGLQHQVQCLLGEVQALREENARLRALSAGDSPKTKSPPSPSAEVPRSPEHAHWHRDLGMKQHPGTESAALPVFDTCPPSDDKLVKAEEVFTDDIDLWHDFVELPEDDLIDFVGLID